MSTAEDLLELMFSWIRQRELCADQLRELARELESLRKNCNTGECIGSSVAVIGTACLIGAGVATFFTAGAAAPFLGVVGAFSSGAGLTISVASKIIEGFLSSEPMKEAKKVEERSNKISDKIQKQLEKLKAEAKTENPSANPDELDQHTTSKILTVMARRSGLKGQVSMCLVDGEPQIFLKGGPGRWRVNNILPSQMMFGVAGLLSFFTFRLSGKAFRLLFAEGTKQLAKQVAIKAVLKGGAKVVGGAVGMVFALHEAIDNWTDMIKKNHVTEASQSLRDTADKIRKVTQMLREQLDSIKKVFDEMAKRQREQEEEKNKKTKKKRKKKKRNPKVFFAVIIQSDSSAVDSHGNMEAHDEHQRRQRYENRQEGGGYEWRGERERESGQSETTGGQGPGGGGPGGWESDSEDEDRSQTDEDSSSDEEIEDDDSSEEIIERLVRMGLLNVHSIKNKLSLVSALIDQEGLQVLFLTETWLNPGSGDDVLRQISLRFVQQPRKDQRGGGVAVLYPGQLNYQGIPLGLNTSFEYLTALMRHDEWRRPILTITLYRPPGYRRWNNMDLFLEGLKQLLDVVSNQYESILITGDFNIWVDVENRRPARRFREFLEANGFVQHVEGPTYRSGHTLDLVISRNVDVSNLVVQNNEISDHKTISFSAKPLSKRKKKKGPPLKRVRHLK